jgi:hypothetical protein
MGLLGNTAPFAAVFLSATTAFAADLPTKETEAFARSSGCTDPTQRSNTAFEARGSWVHG